MTNSLVNVCFHGIGLPERELEPGEASYWISPESCHRILDELATWPQVRISFDDGNRSDLTVGLPALLARGLTADFFVIAGRFGSAGSLDEDAVRELRRNGMTIGSHGMWHRSWRGLSAAHTAEEFVEARDRIAAVAGVPVQTAACPLGLYDRAALLGLRGSGYRTVFTSDRRPARPTAFLQARYSVRATDTPESLRAEVFAPALSVRRARSVLVGAVKRWR